MFARRFICLALCCAGFIYGDICHAQNTNVPTTQPINKAQNIEANLSSELPDIKVQEETFEKAFRALKRQNQFQFELPSRPPIQRSNWLDKILKPILAFFSSFTPVFQGIFWICVAGVVALFLFIIGNAIKNARFGRQEKQNGRNNTAPLYRPSRQQALILLDQVDALAAKGLYAEAVHQLLFKSIQDISIARPSVIKRSYTSREISQLGPLAQTTREAFALITREVERSHFGSQTIDEQAFLRCRKAYAQFAVETPLSNQTNQTTSSAKLA